VCGHTVPYPRIPVCTGRRGAVAEARRRCGFGVAERIPATRVSGLCGGYGQSGCPPRERDRGTGTCYRPGRRATLLKDLSGRPAPHPLDFKRGGGRAAAGRSFRSFVWQRSFLTHVLRVDTMRCGSSARVANDDVSLASMPSLRIGTVHDATGADTTTEWYEDTGLKISHTNAARAGSDGEEVAEGVLSERANRAAFVARVAPPRGFLFKTGVMLAIGIAGASPRALVLLLSRCVPSVSVAQALSDFPALWAPCAKEGATFSAHSPGGSLFTYLIATDGVLKSGFMLLAYVAALDAVTFFGGARSRGRNRGVRRCAALMSALLFVAPLVLGER